MEVHLRLQATSTRKYSLGIIRIDDAFSSVYNNRDGGFLMVQKLNHSELKDITDIVYYTNLKQKKFSFTKYIGVGLYHSGYAFMLGCRS